MPKLILTYLVPDKKSILTSLASTASQKGWGIAVLGPEPLSIDNIDYQEAFSENELLARLSLAAEGHSSAFIACDSDSSKVIAHFKKQSPKIACAGLFHAMTGNMTDMLDRAYDALLLNKWAVGASIDPAGRSLIMTSERGIQPVASITEFPEKFLNVLASRINQRHHNTKFEQVNCLPEDIKGNAQETLAAIKDWAEWSLFPKYQSNDSRYPGAEFGFVARRTRAGTLITGRGSNKEDPTINDLALLTGMDADGTLHVQGTKLKASLNAPIAHHIFKERPDINWIVHAHAFLPEGANAPEVSAPGTQQDWLSIRDIVRSGATVINQPLHGTLILLRNRMELAEILKRNNLYANRSELYDLAYARFQSKGGKPTHFEVSVASLVTNHAVRVLDLCCGTGASSLGLRKIGFATVDIADGSTSMLAVAEKRLGIKGTIASLDDLNAIPDDQYDLITMRQAFNYVRPEDRSDFFCSVRTKLQKGGQFAFNTFGILPDGLTPPRDNQHQTDDMLVRTRETNVIKGDTVSHFQRTEIIDFDRQEWSAIMDVNVFYQHHASDIEQDMLKAGFKDVQIMRQGSSLTFVARAANDPKRYYTPQAGAKTQPPFN